MAFLMDITFANSCRLTRRVYYFTYRNIRFKLIQNNARKWADVLLTIIPSTGSTPEQQAYAVAGEYLSALSWKNGARIAPEYAGGRGVSENFRLRQAQCQFFNPPQITYGGNVTGFGLSPIPKIETENQRMALALMREARSSNKVWLSFLFYWQIMEIGGGNPVGWVNKTCYRSKAVHLTKHELQGLDLQGKRLGEYFLDRCRDAIAHIRRRPGKIALRFDDWMENQRMAISARIIEQFAEYFVRTELSLTKRLYLRRSSPRGFPTYVDLDLM